MLGLEASKPLTVPTGCAHAPLAAMLADKTFEDICRGPNAIIAAIIAQP